ncbi:MAG: hypothetical protein KA248_05085 [Kiritimatiellae bacterium]|nr:hypothetical protein [Kiritimatiellia bacterium]
MNSASRGGFTFVEIVVALLVAALLVHVAARSLATVFRADRASARLLEGRLLLRQAAAARYLGAVLEDRPEDWPAGWSLQSEEILTGAEPDVWRWKVLRCFTEGLALTAAFRES